MIKSMNRTGGMALGVALLFTVLMSPLSGGDVEVTAVDHAYDLRMSGEAEEAKAMLEALLSKDKENALAWYELARTHQHMGLSKPREIFDLLEPIKLASARSVELAPENYSVVSYHAMIGMFSSYPSIMQKDADAKGNVEQAIEGYESLLKLRPASPVTLLVLTELNVFLDRMYGEGGSKAEAYAEKLEEIDPVQGAKAREILLPEDAKRIPYWKAVLAKHPDDADVLECLSKACLWEAPDKADKYLKATLKEDPGKTLLYLDFARAHVMQGMRNEDERADWFQKAIAYFDQYLATNPSNPMKAYAIGAKVPLVRRMGDKQQAQQFRRQAMKLDPFYSRASGIPSQMLFTPPGEEIAYHRYWFRMF
jgi:tetratricopeptide (TPR) repeat protein